MATSQFSLRNSNDTGPPDLQFTFYPQHAGLMNPVVGDWDGNGTTTVGAYLPGYHAFALTDDPTGVQLSQVFYMQNQMPTLGLAASQGPIHQPLSGNWAPGQASVTPAAYFPTSTLAAEMINETLMDAAFDLAGQRAHTRSLVLVRNGKVVRQEYYHGFTADMRTNIKSESKSVLAMVMIYAVLEGKIPSLNSNLATLLPSHFTSPGKGNITLLNLMNMASGLAYAEQTTLGQMISSSHWVQFMSSLEFPHSPGTFFRYSTGNSHLGAAALQGALMPENLDDYGQRVLFSPLGLNSVRWDYDPQFNPFGGAEMFMPARDQARLGQLLLDIPALEEILTTPGLRPNYGLWTRSGTYSNGSQACHGAYFAGHGGQITLVVPCWQVVIVINSNPDVPYAVSPTQAGENWTVITDLLKAVM